MFITKSEYYDLLDRKWINEELEKEIKRLEYQLNARERTCKIGPWCENCKHWVEDRSVITSSRIAEYSLEDAYYGITIPETIGGRVGYCNKYVHTLCPDREAKE
jgi:hypothetical protein